MDFYSTLTLIGIITFFSAALFYAVNLIHPESFLQKISSLLISCGTILCIVFLAVRWQEAGRPPFQTLYESLILLAGCTGIVYLILEFLYKMKGLLGALCSVGSAIVLIYAFFKADVEIARLPAALQSAWFIPHVVVYFFGYGAVFVAFAGAVFYFIFPFFSKYQLKYFSKISEESVEKFIIETTKMGFVFLTAGLLMGAFWAKSAWGDYWGWDPKETWSLVTWLIFVIILHLRYISGWKGRKIAVLVIAGFCAIIFTYLGMNLLPSHETSLHVYQ